ncbi:MAG: hypothetical protein JXB13_05365 [Phycisphaerae bacterium]|nr:hypothetical protein [Phycisphaerae bacterium]
MPIRRTRRTLLTCSGRGALLLLLVLLSLSVSCHDERSEEPMRAVAERAFPPSMEVVDLGGRQYQVTFRYRPDTAIESVHLAGTFNGWAPSALRMDGPDGEGVFRTTVVLGSGRHEYKFVVDGRDWRTDPENPLRTAGYANAIVHLGVPPQPDGPRAVPADRPVEMVPLAAHPPSVRELKQLLAQADAGAAVEVVETWLAGHPMPLFSENAVSWVYCDPEAVAVGLSMAEVGRRTGYPMDRLVRERPVWVVSLDRRRLGDRMAYTYEVTSDRLCRVVDPCAWSLTSRASSPAGLVVEASSDRGRIEVIPLLETGVPGLKPRDIYVYLPPGYDATGTDRYAVLYLHDGQNCWDDPVEPFGHGGWTLNLQADELIRTSAVAPFIAVGVGNTADRMEEYGPGPDIRSADAHPYLRFLVETLKPRIDERYRTRREAASTAIMGASMGGLISMQAALLRPDVFGQAGCLSPSFVVFGVENSPYMTVVEQTEKVPVRFYFYNGTGGRGGDGAAGTRRVVETLRERGWRDGKDLVHHEVEGAEHNERAWREELDAALRYLFGA